jgi:hypothetical protein
MVKRMTKEQILKNLHDDGCIDFIKKYIDVVRGIRDGIDYPYLEYVDISGEAYRFNVLKITDEHDVFIGYLLQNEGSNDYMYDDLDELVESEIDYLLI